MSADKFPSATGWSDWTLRLERGCRRGFFGSRQATWVTTRTSGGGVWEARLDFGPGYRIYFGRIGREVVLLLLGGDKKSQTKDIKRAKVFWSDYLKEMRDDKTR